MKIDVKNGFVKLFKTSAIFRFALLAGSVLLIIGFSSLIGRGVKRKPVIKEINPPVGSPGDIMIITGDNFGDLRGSSYVELGSSRITASGYYEWKDKQIKIVIPSNAQDGLVTVGTSAGRSEPVFFANQAGIPVAVRQEVTTTLPVIDFIEPEEVDVGDVITISGVNFGEMRGNSKIYFSAGRDNSIGFAPNSTSTYASPVELDTNQQEFIAASEKDFDYQYWSDQEIQVRVPDGASTGTLYIETERGKTSSKKIKLKNTFGHKRLSGKRTYIVQISADIIANPTSSDEAMVNLYMPCPPVTSIQTQAELTESYPEPMDKSDPYTVLYQKQLGQSNSAKQRFNQNFVVSVYSVASGLKTVYVPEYSENRILYRIYTQPDKCIPSSDQLVVDTAFKIIGNARNPYSMARLIYNYMVNNYTVTETVRNGDVSILDLITTHQGDAYDFAMLYASLCRAVGIPAIPVSGVLVEENSVCKSHWWVEIYFETYGWFPVDVALASGLKFKPFSNIGNVSSYYFGNMDSQHIAFSRGWHEMSPSVAGSKRVYRPRTYAMQSIWEEARGESVSYSSLWNDPVILGIY